jgi:hypothetical protein
LGMPLRFNASYVFLFLIECDRLLFPGISS